MNDSQPPKSKPLEPSDTATSESASLLEPPSRDEKGKARDRSTTSELVPLSNRFRSQPPVEEIGHFVFREDISTSVPTCSLSSRDLKDPLLRDRLDTAIRFGRDHLRNRFALYKYKASHNFLTRNQESAFTYELRALRDVVTNVWVDYCDESETHYYLDKDAYFKLRTLLDSCANIASSSFYTAGKQSPPVPIWGLDTSYITFEYNANDFEILSACFRREVECFLSDLLAVHADFLQPSRGVKTTKALEGTRQKEDPDTTEEYVRDDPPHLRTHKTAASTRSRIPTDSGITIRPDHSISHYLRDRRTAPSSGPSRLDQLLGRTKDREPLPPPPPSDDELEGDSHHAPSRHSARPSRHSRQSSRSRRSYRPPAEDPDPSEPSSSDNDGPRRGRYPPPRRPTPRPLRRGVSPARAPRTHEAHFDFKLKMDIVPTWDGNTDSLARWILRVNSISKKSSIIRRQLGMVVPQRLTGDAEVWYYSLAEEDREECEQDWNVLRGVIGDYFMNRSWVEKTRKQALTMRYREVGHSRELPSQYFIRKRELLELVYDSSESELITDIMAGAPLAWRTILTPRLYRTTADLQSAIKLHEDDLLELENVFASRGGPSYREYKPQPPTPPYRARTNLVGWSKGTSTPPFPKDDHNVSARATPESKGARPCQYCGSGKHWDRECKHARQGTKRARANFVSLDTDELEAQEQYDAVYYDELSDSTDEEGATGEYGAVAQLATARASNVNTEVADEAPIESPAVRVYSIAARSSSKPHAKSLRERLTSVFTRKETDPSPTLEEPTTLPDNLIELQRPMA